MKNISNLLLILLFFLLLFTSCKTTEKKEHPSSSTSVVMTDIQGLPLEIQNLTLPESYNENIVMKFLKNSGQMEMPVMAITNFENPPNSKLKASELGIADMLTTELFEARRFDLVERKRLQQVIEEQRMSNRDDFDPETAIKIGGLIGAEYVIIGSISSAIKNIEDRFSHYEINALLTLNVKIVDVETGSIFSSISATGKKSTTLVLDDRGKIIKGPAGFGNAEIEAEGEHYSLKGVDLKYQFLGAAKDAVAKIREEIEKSFPVLGYVLKGGSGDIMTELGTNKGAQREDYIIVFRPGNKITHPATGKVVGIDKKIICACRIVSITDTHSIVRIVNKRSSDSIPINGDIAVLVN